MSMIAILFETCLVIIIIIMAALRQFVGTFWLILILNKEENPDHVFSPLFTSSKCRCISHKPTVHLLHRALSQHVHRVR